jgi:hypothetical protein
LPTVGLSGGLFICPLSDPGNTVRDFFGRAFGGKNRRFTDVNKPMNTKRTSAEKSISANISPLGLALIIGAGDLIKPAANLKSLGLAFTYFAFWYVLGALAFWLIGIETKGRSFEEMDSTLGRSALIPNVGRNL